MLEYGGLPEWPLGSGVRRDLFAELCPRCVIIPEKFNRHLHLLI